MGSERPNASNVVWVKFWSSFAVSAGNDRLAGRGYASAAAQSEKTGFVDEHEIWSRLAAHRAISSHQCSGNVAVLTSNVKQPSRGRRTGRQSYDWFTSLGSFCKNGYK